MSSRNNQDRRRETEDMSASRYARKPIATTAFAFIILFSGIIVISTLPSSFFFDPGSFTGKIRLGDFPIGMFIPPIIPPIQPSIPEISPEDLPQEFLDWLEDLLNNTDFPLDNFTIPDDWNITFPDWGNITIPDNWNFTDDFNWGDIPPGLLPILGGMWYYGYGPFGPTVTIIEAPYNIPRKWRLMTFDQFDGFDWTQSNNTPYSLNYSNPYAGADIHQVVINFQLNGSGRMVLPLPILWDKAVILNSPIFNITPTTNLTWNLFSNEYGDALLNMTNNGSTPINYIVTYNVSYDPNVNTTYISQNVDPNPPSLGPTLPGKYLLTPNIPEITSYIQSFISELTPFSTTNNTYNTVLAALEYFKTRFNFLPLFSTSSANITRFLVNGYGDSKDFASTFAIFLRYLNISTRFIMGTVGFETSIPPWLPLTNLYYWTEVWIPNTTGGGNWVQFDATPVPHKMYINNGTGYFLKDARIFDSRMVTDHFDLIFNSSVNYTNIQNRVSDNFEFRAQLLKNYQPVNRTMLAPIIKINFSDMTDDLHLGEIQVDNNNESILTTNFTASSTVGPHKFNATWFAVNNATYIIVTCNGSTQLFINEINGTPTSSFTNVTIIRGPTINLNIKGNLTDNLTRNPVKDQYIEFLINETNSVIGSGYTDNTGEFDVNLSIPTNLNYGIKHFYANFNGTFIVDYPSPYPDINIGQIPYSESNSSAYNIIIFANTSLTKHFNPSSVFVGENFTVYGNLSFDNGTAFPIQIVNVYEYNSSGEFFVGSNTTTLVGSYSVTFFIPSDHESGVNVTFKVNTSINNPYVLNSSVIPDPPVYIKVNITIFNITPINPVRNVTDVLIYGRMVRSDGLYNLSNEQISILFNNLSINKINVTTLTNETGYFNETFRVPLSIIPGLYTVNATTTNSSYYVWKDDTNWNNITVNPIWLNFSIYNVTPNSVVRGLEQVFISGRVLINGSSNTIPNGEEISIRLNNSHVFTTTTNVTGHFNATFTVNITQAPGSYIINATTMNNANYDIWQDDTSKLIQINPTYLNFTISNVTPNVVYLGKTEVFISGRVLINGSSNPIPSGEDIAILLNNVSIGIDTTTDATGHFEKTFVLPITQTPGNYIINATTLNSSYKIWQDNTSNIIELRRIWVNFTIFKVTPNSVFRGLDQIFISGQVINNDSSFNISNEQILILLNNSLIELTRTNITGHFNRTFVIPRTYNLGTYIINATILNPIYNILKGDISNNITINSTSYIRSLDFNYNSFRIGEYIIISGRISDNLNQEIPGYKDYLSIFMNSTFQLNNNSPITGTNGNFVINCTIPIAAISNHNITIIFDIPNYYSNSSLTRNINIFSAPRVQLSTPTPIAIVGSFMIVIGKAYDANSSLNIMGRSVELKMFGQTIGHFKTDLSGEFVYIIPVIGPGVTFQAFFEGNSTYASNEIIILGNTAPENNDWIWITLLIVGISIGIIILAYWFHKKWQVRKFIESIRIINFNTKLKSLLDGKRYREAIVFLYQIFYSKILEKLKRPPLPGITHRELMEALVQKIQLDPRLIYPFTSIYEESRFSNHLITKFHYSESYKLFEKLMRKTFEIREQIEIIEEPEIPEPEVPSMETDIQL